MSERRLYQLGGQRAKTRRASAASWPPPSERWLAVVGLAAALVAACGQPGPARLATPFFSDVATGVESPPSVTSEAFDEARLFRARYGLRDDEAWILAVANNPDADIGLDEFGVPLMPAELAELRSRRTDRDLLAQIKTYGTMFPESFAGVYVDQRASLAFIASFKDDSERH